MKLATQQPATRQQAPRPNPQTNRRSDGRVERRGGGGVSGEQKEGEEEEGILAR